MKVLALAVAGILATIGIIFGINAQSDSYSDTYNPSVVQDSGY